MSLRQFFGELQKGLKSPAYLLYSDDQYLLKEAILSIKMTIPDHVRDIAFYGFDSESSEKSMKEAVEALYTVPFFNQRKVVVVEDCQRLPEKELYTLKQYISRPSPDSLLVLLYITEKGKFKKSHKEILEGAVLIAMNIREADIPLWIREKASGMGFTLSDDAVDYLIGVIGPDAGLLSSELKKFIQVGKERLDRNDIREIIKGTGGYDVFDLVDALKKNDPQGAFKIYSSLVDSVEPQNLLGAINWHYMRMPDKGSAYLKRVFKILNETDIEIKSSGSFYPMEYMLIRLLRL